jgi:5'-3' exoribonuclease 1
MEDVRKGFKVDMTFDQAEPFKPFQQLMGVLPSRSRTLLPEAYRV